MLEQRGFLKARFISLSLERSLELRHLGLAQELSKGIRDAGFFQLCAVLYTLEEALLLMFQNDC